MMAAEIINMRHGWQQPQEIRDMRKEEIAKVCEDVLQKLPEFDIAMYFNFLRSKGYEVKTKYDKNQKLVGYTVGKNASVFKASEISRRFMASQLESTWKKFHPKPAQVTVKPAAPTFTPSSRPVRPTIQTISSTTSTHLLAARLLRFQTRSRIFSSMSLRFQRAMIPPLLKTLPIQQCFFLLGTSMPLLPCLNLAEVVAVLHLNLVGAKKMTRMNAPMLADASRWHIPCASQKQLNAVSTVKTKLYIYD